MRQMPAGNLIVGLELGRQGIPAFPQDSSFFFINRPQNQFTDQKADDIAYYLNRMFGEDSALPRSPRSSWRCR